MLKFDLWPFSKDGFTFVFKSPLLLGGYHTYCLKIFYMWKNQVGIVEKCHFYVLLTCLNGKKRIIGIKVNVKKIERPLKVHRNNSPFRCVAFPYRTWRTWKSPTFCVFFSVHFSDLRIVKCVCFTTVVFGNDDKPRRMRPLASDIRSKMKIKMEKKNEMKTMKQVFIVMVVIY